MAITARFDADFSSFSQAVENAQLKLRGFEGSAANVEKSLNRVVDSFTGRKIISEAALAAEAITRIGGTSKLTAAELQRVGATAAEAAEKLRAWGQDVPKNIQALAGHAKTATTNFHEMKDAVATLAGAFGIAFGVGAIVQFGREVLQAGDTIQKMADQTGLSTTEVQKLQYVAGQSGTSITSLVSAVQNLQQRLGDDNSGAAGAMKKLGINTEAFNRLSTYEQMTSLSDAIKSIKDPTEQASLAAAVFGKNWKEILPAIKSGMKDVGDQAPIMAEATVKALDRVGDALTRAKQQAVTWGGGLVLAFEHVGFALGDFLSKFNPEHFGVATSEILRLQGALNDPDGLKGAINSVKPPTIALGEAFKLQATHVGVSTSEIQKHIVQMTREQKAADDVAAALKKLLDRENEMVRASQLGLFGGLIGGLHSVGVTALETSAEMQTMLDHENAMIGTGPVLDGSLTTTLSEFDLVAAGAKRYADQLKHTHDAMLEVLATPHGLVPAQQSPGIFDGATAGGSNSLMTGLKGMLGIGGAKGGGLQFGDLMRSQGVAAGLNFVSGMGGALGGAAKGAQIGMIAGPWGAAIGAGIGAIAGAFSGQKLHKQTNDLRDAFEKTAGGLDTLNKKAHDAGMTLEHYLNAKTPEQYKKAIDELNGAFEFQDHAANVLNDTIKKYGFSIEELGPAMQRQNLDQQAQGLFQDWKVLTSAQINLTAVTGRMTDSVNDYFHMALKTGTEIPAAMRPMLQQFVDLGLLTDVAGNAVSDLGDSGVTFAETMTEGFKLVAGSVDKLTAAIARMLGITNAAADAVANFPTFPDTGPQIPSTGSDQQGYAGGTHGRYLNFGSGTRVTLHGRERVMTEGEGQASGSLMKELKGLRDDFRRQPDAFALVLKAVMAQG